MDAKLSALFVVSFLQVLLSSAKIENAPVDVATSAGSDVMLNCTVSSNDLLAWTKGVGKQMIFLSAENKVTTPSKHKITGRYDLTVMSTTVLDGDIYYCKLYGNPATEVSANLMVFEPLTCGSHEVEYIEGDEASIYCQSTYGGPVKPTLMYHYNNVSITDVKETASSNVTASYLTAEKSMRVMAEDDGNDVICHLHMDKPEYDANCTFTMKVMYSPRNLTIHPNHTTFYNGEEVRCNASGNPAPQISWQNLNMTSEVINSDVIRVTSSMMGWNSWRCTATNMYNGTTFNATLDVWFEVASGMRTTPGPVSSSPMTSSLMSTLIGGLFMLFICRLLQ